MATTGAASGLDGGEAAPSASANPWDAYTPTRRWWVLFVLFLVSLSNYVDRHLMSVLLEPIKTEFGATDTQMGLLTGIAFSLFYATLGIPVARWADRGDRRKLITLSLGIWSFMTVLCGYAKTFPLLFLARMGVGVGEAGAIPPAQSLIADYFPPEQRARALAVFMASATFGYLIAFTGGSLIAAEYGWRWGFIAMGAPGLLLCLVTWFGLSEPRKRAGGAGATRDAEPFRVTLNKLFAKRSFVLLTLSMILYFLVAYGAVTWFPAYMGRVLELSLASVGTWYGLLSAAGALVGTLGGGWLADALSRRGVRWSVLTPALIMIVSCPIYLFMFWTDDFVWFMAAGLLGGIGLSAAVPAMFTVLHRICGSPRRATAVALMFFFSNLIGAGAGPLITGALSDAFAPWAGVESLRYALMISLCFLAPSSVLLAAAARYVERDSEP